MRQAAWEIRVGRTHDNRVGAIREVYKTIVAIGVGLGRRTVQALRAACADQLHSDIWDGCLKRVASAITIGVDPEGIADDYSRPVAEIGAHKAGAGPHQDIDLSITGNARAGGGAWHTVGVRVSRQRRAAGDRADDHHIGALG